MTFDLRLFEYSLFCQSTMYCFISTLLLQFLEEPNFLLLLEWNSLISTFTFTNESLFFPNIRSRTFTKVQNVNTFATSAIRVSGRNHQSFNCFHGPKRPVFMTELWPNKKSCYIIIHTLYSRLVNSSSAATSQTRPFEKADTSYGAITRRLPTACPSASPAAVVPHMGNHLAGAALVSFTCHSAPRKNSTCNIVSGLNIEEPCKCPACQGWSHATWPPQSPKTSRVHQSGTTGHSPQGRKGGRARERDTAHVSARRLHKSRGAHFPRTLKPFWRPHISSSHPLQHSDVSPAGPGRARHSHIQAQCRVALYVCLPACLR